MFSRIGGGEGRGKQVTHTCSMCGRNITASDEFQIKIPSLPSLGARHLHVLEMLISAAQALYFGRMRVGMQTGSVPDSVWD